MSCGRQATAVAHLWIVSIEVWPHLMLTSNVEHQCLLCIRPKPRTAWAYNRGSKIRLLYIGTFSAPLRGGSGWYLRQKPVGKGGKAGSLPTLSFPSPPPFHSPYILSLPLILSRPLPLPLSLSPTPCPHPAPTRSSPFSRLGV